MRITHVTSEECWEGVYINDKLFSEGHHVDWAFVLQELVGKQVTSFHRLRTSGGWLESIGSLPQELDKVLWYSAEAYD